MSPFDWIRAINEKDEVEYDSSYDPYIVNKGLSFNNQTLFWANEMNANYWLEKETQFNFFYIGIPKSKRYSKWIKKEKSEDIELISEYFNINKMRAKEVASLMDESQISDIRIKIERRGGRK